MFVGDITRFRSSVVYTFKMSVLDGISKADFKTASDGLLELSEEQLRNIMRSEPITDTYHVEQTPFARSVLLLSLIKLRSYLFRSRIHFDFYNSD